MTARHTVMRRASAPVEQLFDAVVGEDVLPKVLHRWGPVPGVSGTRDLSGPWDTPRSHRTVVLDDGSTAHETLLVFERPERFEYRVDSFTNPLGRVVDHAIGSWSFSPRDAGSELSWTYMFIPRRPAYLPVLALFARTAWAAYMGRCAERCAELAAGS